MNKRVTAYFLIAICFFFISCQSDETVESYINIKATEKFLNKEKEIRQYPNIGDEDIFDFAFINGAPKTEESHEVDEIIKMYATTWTMAEPRYPIVIDLANKEIYKEANIGNQGVRFEEERIKVNDIGEIIKLFEKYDVLSWQNYYSDVKEHHSYEDGASWRLVVQYQDGTIERFRGQGMILDDIVPGNYNAFMKDLEAYVSGHLEK